MSHLAHTQFILEYALAKWLPGLQQTWHGTQILWWKEK